MKTIIISTKAAVRSVHLVRKCWLKSKLFFLVCEHRLQLKVCCPFSPYSMQSRLHFTNYRSISSLLKFSPSFCSCNALRIFLFTHPGLMLVFVLRGTYD